MCLHLFFARCREYSLFSRRVSPELRCDGAVKPTVPLGPCDAHPALVSPAEAHALLSHGHIQQNVQSYSELVRAVHGIHTPVEDFTSHTSGGPPCGWFLVSERAIRAGAASLACLPQLDA